MRTEADHPFMEASAGLLSAIVNSIADPVMVKDENHRWVFVNEAHCLLTGRKAEELIGKSDYDFFPKEEADVFWDRDNEVLRTGRINVNEEFHTDASGRQHTVLTKKSLYCAPDGKLYVVGVFQDITERKEKEEEIALLNAELARQYQIILDKTREALVSTESKLQRISDANIVGVICWHIDGQILDANQAFLDMTGYTSEDLNSGRLNWRAMVRGGERLSDNSPDMRGLLEAGFHGPVEAQYITKTGGRVDVYVAGAFLDSTRQEGVGVVVDISRLKQTENALKQNRGILRKYAAELEKSNRDLEQFAQGVAYGLQVPLRKIQTFSEHMRSVSTESLCSEALDDLERVIRSTYRMQGLIQDLLEVSKIKRRSMPFELVDLSHVLKEVYYDIYFQLKETRSRLEFGNLPTVEGDPSQLEQMFVQLIEFFLKSPGGEASRHIQVNGKESSPGLCEITIKSGRLDMPAEKIEKLFDPFSHFYDAKNYNGDGIILALVSKIVERHNGTIKVQCDETGETGFIIVLPYRQSHLELAQLAESNDPGI